MHGHAAPLMFLISCMQFLKNHSLKSFNTFGIDQKAEFFCTVRSVQDIKDAFSFAEENSLEYLILGGGSNVLLTKDFPGLVIKNELTGKTIVEESDTSVVVEAAAGENWHHFVLWCLENRFYGLENLSLIPGSVGAAPMQNIGAYGVEIKDTFHSLSALSIKNKTLHEFTTEECNFGYRESVFKRSLKNQFFITSVRFSLTKVSNIKTAYGAIQEQLAAFNISEPTPLDVSKAVIAIRESKLPNPKELGNAGSFFKNPIVDKKKAQELGLSYPNIPTYPVNETQVKLAAGWLIEQTGWKGKTIDNRYGVHKKQALVLVNYNDTLGSEIWELSEQILQDVKHKFGVELEREVNII